MNGMNGQWIGNYNGTTDGRILVNIDERHSYYEGIAYLVEGDTKIPSSAAFFKTADKEKEFQFRTQVILAIDPGTLRPVSWDNIKNRYRPDMPFSQYAEVKGSWDEDSLRLSWLTDTGVEGRCVLPRSNANKPSKLPRTEETWESYKGRVAKLEHRRFLFRGQNNPWRLRTSFHRKGRADIERFSREDIPLLHRNLSARTKHVFNLQIADENGSFLNLIQHHGYPTPLLDWTYSPYVAAFFAYRGISNADAERSGENDKVRIFLFDHERWRGDLLQFPLVNAPFEHVTILEFIAIENERMIPQQAASMITTSDDIESYIRSRESDAKQYLWAIDLPKKDRKKVMSELVYMGITAGSLFPGLDGACEELTERNFES
jgi:hypothetical protein